MENITRKRARGIDFDISKCIICQLDNDHSTTSSKDGREKIINAATVRNDVIYDRLLLIEYGDNFVYHVTNECYKSYTLKKSLSSFTKNILSDKADENNNEQNTPKRVCRSNSKQFIKTSPDENSYQTFCVICNKKSQKGEYEKCKISSGNLAKNLLHASIFFKMMFM
ncbi:hypothetical protein ACF0H5_001299 [Mactra antiquata]